ncbi:Ankyrin repeat protein [Legionella beliardensis]|uniref:Ankyrin repeat protein n=1 Tax=Legionella beliardensis TaxID=91822 RepID=A0A378I138_9GAMM|nr:ankyrin repeat domain-containing protein [Legionella beliardensis]STX28316.1 Ankyrin repeat protein [Legionella beliardensis]
MTKVLIRANIQKKMGNEFEAYQKTIESFLADPHQHGLNFEKLEGALGAQKTYSIRHSKKKRLVLCPILHNGQQIWVVTDILPRHQYARLRSLDDAEKTSLLAAMTAGSFDQNNVSEPVIEVSNNIEFFNNQFILLDNNQVQVRDQGLSSLPLIISGAPGSGKTSVLLSTVRSYVNDTNYEEPLPILIIAKSAQLVEFMRAEWAVSAEAAGVDPKRVVFKTPEEIYTDNFGQARFRGENDFVLWYQDYISKQNKLNSNKDKKHDLLPGAEEAALIYHEFHTMSGYETFEDYEKAINSSFSLFAKKSMRARLWDVYQYYREHLKTCQEIDLSFEPIMLQEKYEFIGLDETQDLSRLQIKSLAKSTSRMIFSIGDHQRLFGSESTIPFLRSVFWEQFKKDITTHKVLKASYRCPKAIIEVANGILQLKYRAIGGTSFLDKNELAYVEANPNHSQTGSVQWLEQQKELLSLIEANKNNAHFVVITPAEFLDEAIALFGKERVFTSANFKGLQAKKVLLYKPLSQEGFKAASSAIGESFVLQNPPAAIAKTTTGSIRHSTLFNELFVAATRAEEDLLVFQPYERPLRLVSNPLKTYILAKNSGQSHTQPTVESSKEEWLAHAKKLREHNQHAQAEAIEARFKDLVAGEHDQLILPLSQAQPHKLAPTSTKVAGSNKKARKPQPQTTIPPKEQVKVVASGYNRQKKQDKAFKEASKPNKKLHPVEAFLANETEALAHLIKHKDAIAYVFHLRLDTLNPNLPTFTLIDYLEQPINKEKKDKLISNLISQLNIVASWKNLSKDQQRQQDGLMALLYYQPAKDLPLALTVLKELPKDSPTWYFMCHFKKNRATSLNKEIAHGKVEAVVSLKQLGLINTPDTQGFVSLHIAAYAGQAQIVEDLVVQGANINQTTPSRETPLYIAAYHGCAGVVRVLARLGADLNLRNNKGASPLYAAAQRGWINVAKALIELGADVDEIYMSSTPDKLPTLLAPLHIAVYEGHAEMVETLITLGANINLSNEQGFTPLHLAANGGRIEIINTLIARGVDVNQKGVGHETPLYLAARAGHVAAVNRLVALKADISLGDIRGTTPLHIAAYEGHIKVVEALIALGADINLEDHEGALPIHHAAHHGSIEIVNILIKLRTDINKAINRQEAPLHIAATVGHVQVIEALVKAGANINQVYEKNNASALFIAAQYGYLDIVTYLLANHASSSIACKTKSITLMKIAPTEEAKARAKEFIENKGQTITSEDELLILPADIAYIMGHTEIAQCLQNNINKTEKTLNINHMFYSQKKDEINESLELEAQKQIPR